MTDEMDNLLRSLPLVKPSAALDARIDRLLAPPPAVLARITPWLMAGASFAAAAVIVLLVQPPSAATSTVVIEYQQAWSSLTPQGVVFVDEQTPGYAVQQDTVQQVTYLDPRDGVEITWAWPTQETWVMPIDYQ